MFAPDIYIERRKWLKKKLESGLLLFAGNEESFRNYVDNPYRFRQDSTFLYFWGLDLPGLAAVIDIDRDLEIIFGHDLTLDEIIWTGPRPTLEENARRCGATDSGLMADLKTILDKARQEKRKIRFLPQYRPENLMKFNRLLGLHFDFVNEYASESFIKAVVSKRSVKTEAEVEEIEAALEATYEMQTYAMKMSGPGVPEKDLVAGMMEIAHLGSCAGMAFPAIFTTDGQILHHSGHDNLMPDGRLVINDCGAESRLYYASDITRTFPVSGRFTQKQKEIYTIVLEAQETALKAIRPGVEYRKIHLLTAERMAVGLEAVGLLKGNPQAAVAAGAHTLFFPHGLGHMLGLDVHDMENLGEDYVGYTDTIPRDPGFGLRALRLAKALEPGYVITVEPGLYFIPELIDRWKAEKKFEDFIDYAQVEKYRDFGAVRIEDDVLVQEDGGRVLGRPIPKTVAEVEGFSSQFPERRSE